MPEPIAGEVDASVLPQVTGVRDPAVADELAREGYARLGPLLSPAECDHLNAVFAEVEARLGRPLGGEWFPTILLPDPELRAFINQELGPVVLPHLDEVLDLSVLEPVRVDYSVKPPGPDGLLGPHQDFSIVDERRFTSLYVWIPLIDTDERNGTLHVLPRSHRFSNRVRARHVPSTYDPVLDEVEARSVALDCTAGELVVMVSGVVHFSPPNRSDRLRLAAHGIFKPAEAPLVFYFADEQTPEGMVEAYEVGIDDYIELALGDRPGPGFTPATLCPRPPTEMQPDRFWRGMAAVGHQR